jgi:hypothetical protein
MRAEAQAVAIENVDRAARMAKIPLPVPTYAQPGKDQQMASGHR